jgi:hypothetical protein
VSATQESRQVQRAKARSELDRAKAKRAAIQKIKMLRIRQLARTIRTPQQFEAILADTRPISRDAIRRLLIPLLPFKLPAEPKAH